MSVGGGGSGPAGALAYGGQGMVPTGMGADEKSAGQNGGSYEGTRALSLGADSGMGKYCTHPG